MKKLTTRLTSFILTLSLVFSMVVPAFAEENDNSNYVENKQDVYTIVEQIETPYGTAYNVDKQEEIQTFSFWDIADIIMAGVSWADLFENPSLGNFGWAVLDTAALLPLLPSTAYFRKGGKTLLKIDEVAKFAKTSKGKKAVSAAMKTFKYSDGITSKATKAIKSKFKGAEGKKVLKMFEDAANKGIVGAKNQAGIKKITPTKKIGMQYTHEIKVKNAQYGDYRILIRASKASFPKFAYNI